VTPRYSHGVRNHGPAVVLYGILLWGLVGLPGSWSLWVHAAGPAPSIQEILITVTTPQGSEIFAELADTTEKRVRGLMFRTALPSDRGMLFTFPEPQQWTIWMKNTKIPLDIIWMNAEKMIVHVEQEVPECNRQDDGCPQYQPNKNALYVLEVGAGTAKRLHLTRGVTLKFEVPPSVTGMRPRNLP
jgi:uncharacterized protein